MAEALRDIHVHKKTEDKERSQHQKVRTTFFIGTGLAGFGIALGCLAVGTRLDTGKIPFRTWSLVCYVAGAVIVVAVGQASASLYRRYRRGARHS